MSAEKIFRAYDIRGEYPSEINEEIAYNIGRAFATIFPGRTVVGGDSRLSTPSLKESLARGLMDSGSDVIDIGIVPTSLVYFSCYKLGYGFGIMITASHIPKQYNGMKVCGKDGSPMGLEHGMDKVLELMNTKQYREGSGKLEKKDIASIYTYFVRDLNRIDFSGMKIVVDGSNGSSGKIHADILRKLGVEVTELFCEPDGNFPFHSPDPTKDENITELKKKVIELKADAGFAFDGDGDRLAVVSDAGELVNPNHIFSVLIEEVLRPNPHGKIVHDILSSKLIDIVAKNNNGIPVSCKVGHTFISRKCREVNAVAAGEVSGHYFLNEAAYTDDVLLAAVKILTYMKRVRWPLSKICKKYPKFFQYSNRFQIKKGEEVKFIEQVKKELKEKHNFEIETVDGAKVSFPNGWMLFRPSNTEPVISMGYESSDQAEFEKIKTIADSLIQQIPKE